MNDVRVPIIIGVTGHRDIPSEDAEILRTAVHKFLMQLQSEYPKTPFKLISGLAEGADRLVAEVALDVGFDILAALPMPQTDYEQDFESIQSIEQFRQFIAKAESCFVVPQESGYIDPKMTRDLCYLALGRYIAQHAQIVVALWDGISEQTMADGSKKILTGGTADVVHMCRSGLHSVNLEQILLPEPTWLHHLWVRRRKNMSAYERVGHWAQNWNRQIHDKNIDSSDMQIRTVLFDINKFNAFVVEKLPATKVQQSREWLLEKNSLKILPAYLSRPLAIFAAADAAALQQQTERLQAIKWISGLAIVSIICQQIYSGPAMRWGWLAAHIILAVFAFLAYMHYFRRNSPTEQQYFDWRSLAEALRVQIFWIAGGVQKSIADYYLSDDRDELNWIRQAARNATVGLNYTLDDKMTLWSRDLWLESQRDWFKKKAPENERKMQFYNRLVAIIFAAALFLTVCTLVMNLMSASDLILNFFVLSSGVCFLGSGVLKTYAEQMAYREQKDRYQMMAKIYNFALSKFDEHIEKNNINLARNIIFLTGKEALTENAGWLRLHRQREFKPNIGG